MNGGGTTARRRLLLCVDAPSLLHRNHHARRSSDLRDTAGRPAWALHGMLRQILEVLDRFAPDAVVFGIDDRRASVREDAYPAYKAGRAEKDDTLVEQLERAQALLSALGLHAVTPPGLEADDVSASAAVWAGRQGWDCVLVTSDRDAFAHVSDHCRVLRVISGGIANSPLLTPPRLQSMYGVPAEHYLTYAALRGDASDNLPGVRGLGEKTAALLVAAVGPMTEVWADLAACDGATVAAAVDDLCAELGRPRAGRTVVSHLAAPDARERFEFNHALMRGHTDVDLGLTPEVPGSAGLLPLDAVTVARVVGFLGRPETTDLALRVLSEPPGSRAS
ncbi:5'-3' exonuclease [Nocardioidaceae bacterium]|nr:5'-3' exonuclease [Nocardioidaceae bacterium]